jgi:stage II sporulation protein D
MRPAAALRAAIPVFALLAFFVPACVAAPADTPEVRVLVADAQPSLRLSVKGRYVVRALPSMQVLRQGSDLSGETASFSAGAIRLGKDAWTVQGVRIEQERERDLLLNKSRFRGSLDLVPAPGGKISAINRLDVESYLYGVLNYEVSAWWPMEALKAQAIAARTYALYQASVSVRAPYDLKSGTSSQVYGGSSRERARTRSAVDETRGTVLVYEGKLFPGYFHATCGGQTAAADELWKISLRPLGGRVLCGFCKFSPHFHWTAAVPLADVEDKLKKAGRPVGQVLDVRPVTQTPSARVGSLKITGTSSEAVIAAKDFRVWLGGDRLRSTAFETRVEDDTAKFTGRGWGHGVGLCQWGTLGQALLGRKHWEILRFYYRDSSLSRSYGKK